MTLKSITLSSTRSVTPAEKVQKLSTWQLNVHHLCFLHYLGKGETIFDASLEQKPRMAFGHNTAKPDAHSLLLQKFKIPFCFLSNAVEEVTRFQRSRTTFGARGVLSV